MYVVMSLLLCVRMRVVLVQRCTRVYVYVAIFMIPSNPARTIEYATTTVNKDSRFRKEPQYIFYHAGSYY